MLFHSLEFLLLFLPATVLGVWWAGRYHGRLALGVMLVASLFFYGWWNVNYLALLGISVSVNYWFGRRLVADPNRWLLTVGIVFNLGLIAYYKYAGFFIETVASAETAEHTVGAIILPLGISFFTFQQIAYLVDAYRGQVVRNRFLEYALFVTFFPQLIAGPIVRQAEVVPQFLRGAGRVMARNLVVGLTIFVIGLFKKIGIADPMALIATPVFDTAAQGGVLGMVAAWSGALAYTFQLYFDFSGYSDMAIGLARLFGVRLPLNFNSPYKALNIIDFWRRWHMTLSRFLRNYLYFPLGGSRKGPVRRYINLMVVMLLGGLWHGAGWTFVFWGGLHGAYLAINHGWQKYCAWAGIRITGVAYKQLAWLFTFASVVVAWVFFRAEDFGTAIVIVQAMAGLGVADDPSVNLLDAGKLAGVLALTLILPNTQELMRRWRPSNDPVMRVPNSLVKLAWRPSLGWGLYIANLIILFFLMLGSPHEFIYFQF